MKKILFILPRFNRQKWDSLTDQAWSIARLLTAGGEYQCCIAAARKKEEPAMEVVENVPVHRFLPERKRWRFLRRFQRYNPDQGAVSLPGLELFLQKNDFDLVHVFCGGRLSEKIAQILLERQIPYVMRCSSDMLRFYIDNGDTRESVNNAFERFFNCSSFALQKAARIFCADRVIYRMLAGKLGDRPLCYWMPGVNIELFAKPSKVDFRQFYQISPSRSIILTVGRLHGCRNQKMLLEIVSVLNSRNRNCQLVMISWCENQAAEVQFKALIKERKLENCVTFIPGLPPGDERFCAAFQAASVVVLPGTVNVSAPAVLDAWAAGVPVVTSAVGAANDMLTDGENGRLVELRNFTMFVKSCEDMLDERNRSALEKMRAAGLKTARKLQWENRIGELLEIYKEII